MPRPPAPPPPGPVGDFARYLRTVRIQAGLPDFSQLRRATGYERSALSAAFGGKKLPTWPLAEKLVKCLDGDVDDARQRWASAKRVTIDVEPRLGSQDELTVSQQDSADLPSVTRLSTGQTRRKPVQAGHNDTAPETVEAGQPPVVDETSTTARNKDGVVAAKNFGPALAATLRLARRRRWILLAAGFLVTTAGIIPFLMTTDAQRFPLSHATACRPPMPSQTQAQGEVRNLVEATYQICLAHPNSYFYQQAATRVTSFRPSGQGMVTYLIHVNPDGYVELRITGPQQGRGTWSASWQQNPTSDCWNELIVTSPAGRQITHTTETGCNRTS